MSATTNHPARVDLFGTAGFSAIPSGGSGNFSYSWKVKNNFTRHTFTSTQKSFNRAMGCHYFGNVTVTCVITDKVTQKTKTVTTSMKVGEITLTARTATILKHPVRQNSISETFDMRGRLSDGSGNYSYRWHVNGVSRGGSAPRLTVSCGGPRSIDVKCVITDNCTRQSFTTTRTFTVNPSWCSSGGSGGGGNDGGPDIAVPDNNQ